MTPNELHNAIMNLPSGVLGDTFSGDCYNAGHRDARQAAAELALSSLASTDELANWQRYAEYCRTCAVSGNPHVLEFAEYLTRSAISDANVLRLESETK